MGSREGLDARLGRERLKDTSLDYGAAGGGTRFRSAGAMPSGAAWSRERDHPARSARRRRRRRGGASLPG